MSFLHRMESRFGLTRGDVTIALFLAGTALAGFLYTRFFDDRDIANRREAFVRLVERHDSVNAAHRSALAGHLKAGADSDSVVREWTPLTEGEVLEERTGGGPAQESRRKKLTLQDVAPVNINTAPASVLQLLPGIGEKTAQKIIDYRTASPFRSVDEIVKVKGIGPKKLAIMKAYLTVGQPGDAGDSGAGNQVNTEGEDGDTSDRR